MNPDNTNTSNISAQSRLFSGGYREPETLTCLSFGAGQDSTSLLLAFLHDDAFRERWAPGRFVSCFADTGDEHPATYHHLEQMKDLCDAHGEELYILEAGDKYHSEAWPDLISQYRRNDTVGSKAFRKSCTSALKIAPYFRWLEDFLSREYGTRHGNKAGLYEYTRLTGEKIRVIIGIAAGEEKRAAADKAVPPWMSRNIDRQYPLIERGWDRKACQEYIRSLGYECPPPSLCMRCPYSQHTDVLLMSRKNPKAYAEWVELEQNKFDAHTRKYPDRPQEKNHGVFGAGTTLPGVLAEAEKEYGHLSLEELGEIRMAGHQVASAY